MKPCILTCRWNDSHVYHVFASKESGNACHRHPVSCCLYYLVSHIASSTSQTSNTQEGLTVCSHDSSKSWRKTRSRITPNPTATPRQCPGVDGPATREKTDYVQTHRVPLFSVSRRNRITRQVGNHSVKGAKRRIRPQRHFLEHLLKQTIRFTGMIDNLSDFEGVRLLRAAKKFGSGIRTGCRQFLSRSSTLDFNTLPRDALPKTLRSDHRVPRPSKPGMCRSGTTVDMDTLGRSEGLVYQSVEFHLT